MSTELVETTLPTISSANFVPTTTAAFSPPVNSTVTTTSSTTTTVVISERASEGPSSPTTVREIHKNGWLKKLPSTDRRAIPFAKLPKPEKMWVVFCIHDDVDAFLEYYENRRSAFSHRPTNSVPLTQCLHISSNIVYQDNDFVFSITLESHVIKLAAASREQMIEWMDTLKGKLTELGHLQPHYNVYTRLPETRLPLAPVRDPSSPLPPTPGIVSPVSSITPVRRITPPARSSEPSSPTSPFASFMSSTYSESNIASRLATTTLQSGVSNHLFAPQTLANVVNPVLQSPHCLGTVQSSNSTVISNVNNTISYVRHLPVTPPSLPSREDSERDYPVMSGNTHFTFDVAVSVTTSNTALPVISSASCNISRNVQANNSANSTASASNTSCVSSTSVTVPSLPSSNSSQVLNTARVASRDYVYEPLFLASSVDRAVSNGIRNPNYGGPPRRVPHVTDNNTDASAVSPRTRARSQSEDRNALTASGTLSNGINMQLSLHGLNMSSESNSSEENHRFLTLREKQVARLCQEIQHKGGVRILLPQKDCVNSIAFAECFGSVWITGWKQREHPLLYHSFHIGDRVITIGGRNVTSAHCAHRIMKSELASRIEFVVGRLPYGQAFAIKRDYDAQDLGIIRAGNTAEVIEVVDGGLAARHGLPAKANSCDGDTLCNWMLTEVNGRPLNLFFKDTEVHDRLNAVGKDISILVQPSDFVKALKKQLKSIRNYKEYIVQ